MQYCSLRYFTLSNAKKFLLIKGGKGLTGPICPSLFLNPFPPRPAETSIILLCLMPDYFTLYNTKRFYLREKGKGLTVPICPTLILKGTLHSK